MTPLPDDLWNILSDAGNHFTANPKPPYMAPTFNG